MEHCRGTSWLQAVHLWSGEVNGGKSCDCLKAAWCTEVALDCRCKERRGISWLESGSSWAWKEPTSPGPTSSRWAAQVHHVFFKFKTGYESTRRSQQLGLRCRFSWRS